MTVEGEHARNVFKKRVLGIKREEIITARRKMFNEELNICRSTLHQTLIREIKEDTVGGVCSMHDTKEKNVYKALIAKHERIILFCNC